MRTRVQIAVALALFAWLPMATAQENAPDQPTQEQLAQPAQPDQQPADLQQPAQTEAVDQSASDQTAAVDQETDKLTQHMAACLALGNHAEIELAKMALDKTQNAQVRAFAQKLIEDHTAASERIRQFLPHAAETEQTAVQPEQPNDQQETQAATADDQATEQALAADSKDRAAKDHDAMERLAKKIASNELSMTKDVLMRYEGQDFDMGFLGQQIVCHTQMLAKLHAFKSQGSQDFQVVVSELIGTVEDHFQHATRLSRQLQDREDGGTARSTSARGATSTQPAVRTTWTSTQAQ